MCECLWSWQKAVAFREASRKEEKHKETEGHKPGPGVGVGRVRCPQHWGCKTGLRSAVRQDRAGAAARACWRLEASLGPLPSSRLKQGSSVSGFENFPGNVLLEFHIYPGDNATQRRVSCYSVFSVTLFCM